MRQPGRVADNLRELQDDRLVMLVLELGARGEIYK